MAHDGRHDVGTSTVYMHVYLMTGARGFHKIARDYETGSHFTRLAGILFSAFAFEAYLNELGAKLNPDWESVERNLSFEERLDQVALLAGVQVDKGRPPFQTVIRVNSIRNRLVHARTKDEKVTRAMSQSLQTAGVVVGPLWLDEHLKDAAIERIHRDTTAAMKALHSAAGLDPHDFGLISWSVMKADETHESKRARQEP